MIEELQIKILRLNTGEDIIGACINDEANGSIDIESPMKVVIRRMTPAGKTILLMAPWLPLELIEDNSASINYADIITVVNPTAQFIEYYTNTVNEYEDIKLNESLTVEDEQEDDYKEEVMSVFNDLKKGTLH